MEAINTVLLWLVLIVDLTQPRITREEGTSSEKLPWSDWPVVWLSEIILNDKEGSSPLWEPHFKADRPELYKKAQTSEQASKQHASVVSASVPAWVHALTALSDGLYARSVSQITIFSPNCFVHVSSQ